MAEQGLGAFSHVTVGVASLDDALAFWTRHFGFAIRLRREGPDAALAGIWSIAPERITRQALIATPASGGGWAAAGAIHLVEFAAPLPPVRQGAAVYDRLPKNLDLYTVDMPARCRELEAAGQPLRGHWTEMPVGAHVFREVHLAGHDGINVVLLEALGPGYATTLSEKGYAGIGPLVTIVDDGTAEAHFYSAVLGIPTTLELLLEGPEIERLIGLPQGAGLRLSVHGDPDEPLGRIESIEYQGVRGANLYPRAVPPATGILHMNYRVRDLAPLRARLARAGVAVAEHGTFATMGGSGPVISFRSPAGFRIEAQG